MDKRSIALLGAAAIVAGGLVAAMARPTAAGGAPTVLFRRGFSKTSLQAGTQIVVDGYRAKDGTNKMNAREITFADGRKLFAGSEGTGAPR